MDELRIETPRSVEELYELGMRAASGRMGLLNLVEAHKWFNLAAMKGHADAVLRRREVAAEMADREIGLAQRAARDWLKSHPEIPAVVAPQLAVAA